MYLLWRSFFTLNFDQLVASGLFLLSDIIAGISAILFYEAFRIHQTTDEKRTPKEEQNKKFSVDVLIPTLNEGIDILERTVAGCIEISYPHSTYILDDGNRPEVRKLAEKKGVNYISRKSNINAKAGNLNNALKDISGELIVVFDADFVPKPDFLNGLTDYFNDDSVAVVQTPQEYYNTDSFQHIRMPVGKMYNDQDFFMRSVLPARNNYNAAYWIGTNAIIRRKAIDSVGGFAIESVTEDLLTSIKLHENGWKIIYINESRASGLAPVNASQYFIQRRRWAQGAIQVLMKNNPLFSRNLTGKQRLSYLASVIHFIDGASKLIFYLFPALFFITGVTPVVPSQIIISVMVLYFCLSLFFRSLFTRRSIFYYLYDEIFSVIRSFPYLSAFTAFVPGKKIKFAVTPKCSDDDLSVRSILGPFIVFTLSLAALVSVALNRTIVFNGDLFTLICFVWCLYFCAISGVATYLFVSSFTKKHGIAHVSIFKSLYKLKVISPSFMISILMVVVLGLSGGSGRNVLVTGNVDIPSIPVPKNFDKLIEIKKWFAIGPFSFDPVRQSPIKAFSNTDLKRFGIDEDDFVSDDIKKLDRLTGNMFLINDSTSFVRLFGYVGTYPNIERLSNFYLFTAIDCEDEVDATLIFDGSNSYKLWLNGVLLEEKRGKLNINKVGDRFVNVSLKKGKNILLAKVNRGTNLKSWDFVCGIATAEIAKDIYRANYLGDFVVNPIVNDSLAVYTGPYNKAVLRITDDYGDIAVVDSLSSSNWFTVSLPGDMAGGFYNCCLYLGSDSIVEDIYKGDYRDFVGAMDAEVRSTGLSGNNDIMANFARVEFLNNETVGDNSPDELRRLNRNRVYWGRALSEMVENVSDNGEINDLTGTFLLTYSEGNDSAVYSFVSHVGNQLPLKGNIPVIFAVPYALTGDYMPEDWYTGNLDQIMNDNNLADQYGFALVWLYSGGKDYSPLTADKDLRFALEKIRSLYDIDTTRLFLMGDCEGGRRAMALARDNPGLFRGIATTSPLTLTGNGDIAPIEYAGKLAKIPMIIRHGKHDEEAGIENSLRFVTVANKLGFYPELIVTENSHISFERDYREYSFAFFDSISRITPK
jgi:cellulose synthase (UDP-forming)